MKRFWIFITTFSLAEWIGRHPASAGLLMLLGIGGGIVGGNLITPSITPQPAAYFNQSNQQLTNNALKPNGGTTGAFLQPTDAAGSFAVLFDATVDSALGGSAAENLFGGLTLTGNQVPGQSSFLFQRNVAGQTGTFLWNAASAATNVSVNASGTMSGYNTGFYPFTASGNCIRNPSGVWQGGGASIQITDPGFGCPLTPTVSVPSIPNAGAQQTGVTATCASGGAGMLVTTNVPVAPGLTAGQTYNLSGFTTSPANALNTPTWTAVSVTGSGPYSIVGTAAGSCPTISSTGALGSGTGASIAFPTISTTNPYQFGGTGITTRSGQHICGALIENGNDSAFPGAAALAIVDDQGNALPGAPAVVPFLNQGTANFRGYITAGTQSASSPALTVTAMNAYTISGAAFTGGRATFVTSTSPGFVPGSEFTVSGVSSTGPGSYNHTYVAVAGTSGTTIVANPLSGPAGTPQSISSPGTYSSGGTMVSVILPGMKILGSDVINGNSANISPYGTFGGTGTGGVGAYGLTANPTTTTTFTVSSAAGLAITVTGTPAQPIVVGTTFVLNSNTYVIASLGTGTGGAGTYNVASGSPASGTATMTGSIGSSGAPVTLFAFPGYFYTAAASSNPAGGVVTDRTGVSMGDFTGQIGSSVTNVIASVKAGWGGSIGNVAMLYGPMPMAASGAPDMTKLANLCKKTTTLPAFAAANGMTVHSFYPLNDIGIYGDASVAQISGYIAATAGATSGVLNLVGSPTTGALTGSGSATLSGPGIPGCPAACPAATLGAGPTYTVTWGSGIGQNVGSGGSPVAMAAGAYKPAMPIQSVTFKGYVDGSPATTLHVTSFDDGVSHSGFASFTGVLGTSFTGSIASNTLTVTAPTTGAAVLGVGTTVCPPVSNPSAFTCANVTALGTGLGLNGTYTIDGSPQTVSSQAMYGGGILPGPATSLQTASPTGTIAQYMVVTDGGVNLTAQPLLITGGSGSAWTVNGNYYQSIGAKPMTATLSSIVPGEYIQNANTAGSAQLPNPVKVLAYQGACGITGAMNGGLGCYTISTAANGAVASSGSPATFAGTTITDGGAIAPGPALTIRDQGPNAIFPIDLSTLSCSSFGSCSGTGTLHLSGTYDASTLGGTPSGIQVLVSQSAGGAPLTGCTPCNWGALTATISGGAWSGTISGIPSGMPYSVSVRATNGTAYATLPSAIGVGFIFDIYGQGQAGAFPSQQSGTYLSYFSGLWGFNGWRSPYSLDAQFLMGPPVVGDWAPGQTITNGGDRFGIGGVGIPLSEGVGAFEQPMSNAFGWPTSFVNMTHDGIGNLLMTLGDVAQTQTVAVGDGTKTVWCSAAKYCANVGQGGALVFNAASLTGAQFTGSIATSGGVSTLTVGSGSPAWTSGALEPGMILSGAGISGSPKLLACTTGCSGINGSGSTWALDTTLGAVSSEAMRADPAGGAPWPTFNFQTNGTIPFGLGGFGAFLVKAGTFTLSVNGSVVCQDSQTFAYGNTGGNCTGAGIASSFVNYQTGDYQVTFSSPPASGAAITAAWTNIVSPEAVLSAQFSRPTGIDYFGDGTFQSGPVSSIFNKTPGGVSGHINSGCSTDEGYILQGGSPVNQGYEFGAPGYSTETSWLYGTKFPNLLPGMSATVPQIVSLEYRGEGPSELTDPRIRNLNLCDQWGHDFSTQSTFTGSIASSVLTLSADAVGPMWEGEVIGGGGRTSPTGIWIQSLASGAWGKSGSTYNLTGASGVTASGSFFNDVYYKGAGPAIYAGPLYDIIVQNQGLSGTTGYNPHMWNGFTGGRRVGARLATTIWGAMSSPSVGGVPPANASPPSVGRVKADAGGCGSSAIAAPCFDIGNTYAASANGTVATVGGVSVVTFSGGLAAHARPFVVGQSVTCSGCTPQAIAAVSLPPTQSTRTGEGQIGQSFTITLAGSLGVTGSKAITAGCSGTAGTSANCIDIAFTINTTAGTFGTAAALATCGANNLNGNAPNYAAPAGVCQDNGVGELIRAFRIGTAQAMAGTALTFPTGSVFDDGLEFFGGSFNQSAAFTCNLVAAKVVQCVKGSGTWSSGATFVQYGDMSIVSGRLSSVLGYVGGQSFPITSGGTGYSNQTVTAACTTTATGKVLPKFDITTSGGVIVGVYPSSATGAAGYGVGSSCTVTPTGGSGAVIPAIALAPVEGAGGIGTFNTDSNTMGMFLYDNTGFPGNPLNSFFTNGLGGYFEPGLPVGTFGQGMGAVVSG